MAGKVFNIKDISCLGEMVFELKDGFIPLPFRKYAGGLDALSRIINK
jgi:hypothetical protein